MSEVILGKRKLKGKHVSIYLRSRPSYSDRNIPRDEQGSSISPSRLMKHFYRWRSHLFYSVLTKQLLFPFIEWSYSQGNQALYLWCFPGSWKGLDCHMLHLLLVTVPNLWMNSPNPDSSLAAGGPLLWPGLVRSQLSSTQELGGAERLKQQRIPAHLYCLLNLI